MENAIDADNLLNAADTGSGGLYLGQAKRERVTWLWPGRLPAGKLVIVEGDPGTGKSTVCMDWAARVSAGRAWPDGNPCPVGNVVLMSAEDGTADTIAPRLRAAGGDPWRCWQFNAMRYRDEQDQILIRPPELPRDVPALEERVTAQGARLVIVDVLAAFLSGRVDSHRDQDVRGALAPLAAMADRTGATVVLIRHLNKGSGAAMYRGGGSIGIIGAARAAFVIAKDEADPERMLMACQKSNLAAMPPTLAYRLVSDESEGCARVEWDADPVEATAAQLLSQDADPDRNDAQQFILDYLESKPYEECGAREIIKAGYAAGFSENAMKHARQRSTNPRIVTRKSGMGGGWAWAIDAPKVPTAPQGAEGGRPHTFATFGGPLAPSGGDPAPSNPGQPTAQPAHSTHGPQKTSPPIPEKDKPEMPTNHHQGNVPQDHKITCRKCGQPLAAAHLADGFTTCPGCDLPALDLETRP